MSRIFTLAVMSDVLFRLRFTRRESRPKLPAMPAKKTTCRTKRNSGTAMRISLGPVADHKKSNTECTAAIYNRGRPCCIPDERIQCGVR